MSTALIVGPEQHGVVILARALAEAAGWRATVVTAPDPRHLLVGTDLPAAPDGLVHVHFTDALFGRRCDEAATAFVAVVDAVRNSCGAGVAVTLHDVPQRAEVGDRYTRRTAAYRDVVRACDTVIVNSEHEATQLLAFCPGARPVVVPLPIDVVAPAVDRPVPSDDVAILGFVYPGKGHEVTLGALTALAPRFGLTALGRAADGHEALVDRLAAAAERSGRRFSATGFLPEPELVGELRRAAIPVVAHRHISASGSIGSWIGAGRRPLVPDGPYTRELEARCPGTVVRYPPTPDGLADALRRAAEDPDGTWLAPGTAVGPDTEAVARRYAEVLDRAAVGSPW